MKFNSWTIGLFLLLGIGLFTTVLFLIGDEQKVFNKHFLVYAEFTNLSGLPVGAKIRVSGLDAGEVKKIEIPTTASGKFRLELQLESKVHVMVRADSVASIQTEGVVGDEFLFVDKGSGGGPQAVAGSTLRSKEPVDLAALIESGSGLLNVVREDVTDIRDRADLALDSITKTVHDTDNLVTRTRPDIARVLSHANNVAGTVNELLTYVNQGKGVAGLILKDETSREQVQTTLLNAQRASADLQQASSRLNDSMADLQSRDLPAKASAALDNVQALSLQLNVAVKQILAKDDTGQDGASYIRETLSSLDRSTTNLAEDTEALKHNFFLRGFFKRRGFYTLDEVTPAEYVAACEQHKHTGIRLWLGAEGLARASSDDGEQLSEDGRREIQASVAPYLKSIPGQIIMVEGYSTERIPDTQFIVARRRAELVRQYLEVHYGLRHDDIGVVVLGSEPPVGAGRMRWDGAAIMLMK